MRRIPDRVKTSSYQVACGIPFAVCSGANVSTLVQFQLRVGCEKQTQREREAPAEDEWKNTTFCWLTQVLTVRPHSRGDAEARVRGLDCGVMAKGGQREHPVQEADSGVLGKPCTGNLLRV